MEVFHNSNAGMATEAKVQFLSQPNSYADCPRSVEVLETHMSWVFLTDNVAYKLKKPVRYEFLDFSTVEARYRDCEAELHLNRRLAPEIYLGIIPLSVDPLGNLHLEGEGQIVDWLVKMRRLPRDGMLDWAIEHQAVQKEDIRKIASLLAEFYKHLSDVNLSPETYRDRLSENVSANLKELLLPSYGLPENWVCAIAAGQLAFLDRHSEQIDRRVRSGHLIEGHGDLRPEHICLKPKPAIIDCLEFNREFRILDAADELAFLALECERLGAAWIGNLLFETYSNETDDYPPVELIEFYKSYRAYLRAKIAVWHAREPGQGTAKTWFDRAKQYLQLAKKYLPPTRGSNL